MWPQISHSCCSIIIARQYTEQVSEWELLKNEKFNIKSSHLRRPRIKAGLLNRILDLYSAEEIIQAEIFHDVCDVEENVFVLFAGKKRKVEIMNIYWQNNDRKISNTNSRSNPKNGCIRVWTRVHLFQMYYALKICMYRWHKFSSVTFLLKIYTFFRWYTLHIIET